MTPKPPLRTRIVDGIKSSLKWLSRDSNLAKSEVAALAKQLEQVDKPAKTNKDLPSKAMGDLKLDDVKRIFRIAPVTTRNAKPGDNWDVEPLMIETLPDPQAFVDFRAFLGESHLPLMLACY
jgi:hypothetical protein